jgi:hypothetical protein
MLSNKVCSFNHFFHEHPIEPNMTTTNSSATPEMLDVRKLEAASGEILEKLKSELEGHGFSTDVFHRLTGKQVTRYVNINDREESYLRKQLLHANKPLATLVDFFMLSLEVGAEEIVALFSADVFAHLLELGIVRLSNERATCPACLAPLAGKYFLNDGNKFNDNMEHVLTLVLEQPYVIAAAKQVYSDFEAIENGKILDICTGSGVIGQSVQPANWEVLGVDINKRAVAYAAFNSILNNTPQNRYKIADAKKKVADEKFDIVISNPPYNAYVPTEKFKNIKDITLHAGSFGNEITGPILEHADSLLNDNGAFFMIGTLLLKDGKLWHKSCEAMAKEGTLILLHQPISDVKSWEGMRLLFDCTPGFEDLENGALHALLDTTDEFNQVAWGILIYIKGGTPGYHAVYNLPTDGELICKQNADLLEILVGRN